MPRGRNYPAIGLPEAIERARELYDQDGTALTAPEVAVEAWGYTTLNGASLRVLAALRQYGLLADSGDQTKLSDRALAILLEPEDSPERARAIREAAVEPTIFREIFDEYGGDLPSDAALRAYLVRREAFKESSAVKLIAALRETLTLADETQASYSESRNVVSRQNIPPEAPRPQQRRQEGSYSMPQVRSSGDGRIEHIPITLDENTSAVLSVPVPMPKRQYAKLRAYLNFWLDWAEDTVTEGTEPPPSPSPAGETEE